MTPVLLNGPALEPVSLADAKGWLRVDSDGEDALIGALVTSARLVVEAAARMLLVSQQGRLVLDRWPTGTELALPLAPIMRIDAVRTRDAAGDETLVAPETWRLSGGLHDPAIFFHAAPPAPGRSVAGIEIDVTAGFGVAAEDVPEDLRQAIRLLVARWHERRGDADTDTSAFPPEVSALIMNWRRMRLA